MYKVALATFRVEGGRRAAGAGCTAVGLEEREKCGPMGIQNTNRIFSCDGHVGCVHETVARAILFFRRKIPPPASLRVFPTQTSVVP